MNTLKIEIAVESRYQLRRAWVDEADDIALLVNSVFRGETGLRSWTGEAHLLAGQRIDADEVRRIIRLETSAILIAFAKTDPGRLLGCVQVERRGSCGYLGMLTVDVGLQKAGLGGFLVREAERYVREVWNLEEMEMTVISVRTELLQWYERRGYGVTAERRPFPYHDSRFGLPLRSDLEFVVLRKNLGPL